MVQDGDLVRQIEGCFAPDELEWDVKAAPGSDDAVAVRLVHRPTEREVESEAHATLARNKAAALLGMAFLLLNERSADAGAA